MMRSARACPGKSHRRFRPFCISGFRPAVVTVLSSAVGAKRSSFIRVPYFGVALKCLPGTELVLTITSGMTAAIKRNRDIRLVKAPQELRPFYFLMAWHPRVNSDSPHVWLRQAMRSAAASLNEQPNAVEDFRSHRKGATR